MTKEENRILEFLAHFHRICLEERDMDQIERMLDERISWIGIGMQNVISGREEVRKLLNRQFCNSENRYELLKADYQTMKVVDGVYSFAGDCYIRRICGEQGEELELRVTGLCVISEEAVKLLKTHYSFSGTGLDKKNGTILTEDENARVLRRLFLRQSEELEEKNRDMDALIQNIPGGVICCTNDQRLELISYSVGFLHMFGYTREEIEILFSSELRNMIVPGDLERMWPEVRRQLALGNTKEIEYRVKCRDGRLVTVQERGQLVERGGKMVFYSILMDITERRAANEALKMSFERYQIVFNQTTDIMFEWDMTTDTMVYSANWQRKLGYPPTQGMVSDVIEESVRLHPDDRKISLQMRKEMLSGVPYAENDIRIAKSDGTYMWFQIRSSLQTDSSGRPVRAIGTLVDIDKQRREREKLKVLAQQDSLTGLYNRGTIQTKIQRLVSKAGKEDPCALLILDVDDFKLINDTYGHLSGDMMLKDIAAELKKIFPKDAAIGRVGGDEFAILLYHVSGRDQVKEKAEQILKSFKRLLPAGMEAISCSVGIAVSPEDGKDFAAVYKAADSALYHAKRFGKNRYSFYQPSCRTEPAAASILRERSAGEEMECCTLVNYVFEILSQGQNVEASIAQILELTGKQMEVSRAYIFENDEDDLMVMNTFEWCNEGIKPRPDQFKKLEIGPYGSYYDNFDETGVFYCKDLPAPFHGSGAEEQEQSVKATLQCVIVDENKIRGFVGFDECSKIRYWTKIQINMLQIISRIAGIYLRKDRIQTKLRRLKESCRFMVGEKHHWLYVVEKESYRLLYVNEQMKRDLSAWEGKTCYEVLFREKVPCEDCPIGLFGKERTCAAHGVWIDSVKSYVLAHISCLPWHDGQEVYMVDGCPVEKVSGTEST